METDLNFTLACLAPTGNAVSNLPNGLTIHSTHSILPQPFYQK